MTGTLQTPTINSPNSSEEPKIPTAITTLNGLLSSNNKLDGAQVEPGTLPNSALAGSITAANLAGSIPDSKLASPNNSVYKTIMSASAYFGGKSSGASIFGFSPNDAGVGASTTLAPIPLFFDYASGEYSVGSLTTKFRVKMEVAVGSTSPSTVTFTAGLYPVTVSAGNFAFGTVTTGSTALSSGLATNTISRFNSGDFSASALANDPGAYVLGVVIGSITVPAGIALNVQLQTRNV